MCTHFPGSLSWCRTAFAGKKRCLFLNRKKVPFGIVVTLREKTLAAAMRKAYMNERESRDLAEDGKGFESPRNLTGGGSECQPIDMLPRPRSSLAPLLPISSSLLAYPQPSKVSMARGKKASLSMTVAPSHLNIPEWGGGSPVKRGSPPKPTL